jgi:hypothetical protein
MEEKFSRQAAKFAKKKYVPEAKTPFAFFAAWREEKWRDMK